MRVEHAGSAVQLLWKQIAQLVVALGRPRWERLGMAGLAALVVARHGGNLVRLARGQEPAL